MNPEREKKAFQARVDSERGRELVNRFALQHPPDKYGYHCLFSNRRMTNNEIWVWFMNPAEADAFPIKEFEGLRVTTHIDHQYSI